MPPPAGCSAPCRAQPCPVQGLWVGDLCTRGSAVPILFSPGAWLKKTHIVVFIGTVGCVCVAMTTVRAALFSHPPHTPLLSQAENLSVSPFFPTPYTTPLLIPQDLSTPPRPPPLQE